MLALLLLLGAAISLICYAASPVVALALPVFAAFLVLCCLAPARAVAAGCVLAPLEGLQVPIQQLGALSPTEVAFLLIAVGWVWRALTGADGVRFPQIADYPILALILTLPVGLLVGAPFSVVLRLTVMWCAFFLVFLTVKGFSPSELRLVVLALGVGAGVLGALGTLAYVRGGGAVFSGGGSGVAGRAAAGIADPNYYGAYLQLAAIPLLGLLLGGRMRWRPAVALALLLAGAGLVLSLSRGALIGGMLAVGVVVLAWSRTRTVTIVVLALLAVTTLANLNPLLQGGTTEVVAERLGSIGVETENNKRTLIWRETLGVIEQHPLGVGALQFGGISGGLGLTQRGVPLENVHNQYLNIAVELGLAGLLAYLLWLVRVTWDLAVEWRRRRPETFGIVAGVAGAFVGYSFQALTISQYRVETVFATMFVLTGVAAAARAWPGPESPDQTSAETSASAAALS